MQPVEDRTAFGIWCRSEQSADWLQEAHHRRDCSQNCVWVLLLWPSTEFDEDQHKSSDGQQPGQHHATAMPLQNKTKNTILFAIKFRMFEYCCVLTLTANHWSLPHDWLPTHVCLKYLAKRIPIEAVPIHATNIKAACRRKNNLERPASVETSAKFDGDADAMRPMSW